MTKEELTGALEEAREARQALEKELESTNEGVIALMLELSNEIAKAEQAEEALRKSEKSLRLIYDTAGDVLYQLRAEPGDRFRFLSVNQAFLTATGLTAEDIVGKTTEEVIPEPSHTLALGKYKEAIREQKIVRWEETTEYPSGVRVGDVAVAPAFDENGVCTHLIGSVHDVTARKAAEKELQRHREHLEDLVAERTKELKTMVNAMAGREVRMAELKGVDKLLRAQLEEAGMTPVADDPSAGAEMEAEEEMRPDES